MQPFPQPRVAVKRKNIISGENEKLSHTITVAADEFGIVYKLWISVNVATQADIEALPAMMNVTVAIGTLETVTFILHPFFESHDHLTKAIDLGPWHFDFMPNGLYSGVMGEDIVITVQPAGVGNKVTAVCMYSNTMETD